MSVIVRCDDCAWSDTVSDVRHLRAWYRAACPACGRGEIIDESERRVVEEIIAMVDEGLVEICEPTGPIPAGKVRAILNTALDPMLSEWERT